jgi:hypothetical protein
MSFILRWLVQVKTSKKAISNKTLSKQHDESAFFLQCKIGTYFYIAIYSYHVVKNLESVPQSKAAKSFTVIIFG